MKACAMAVALVLLSMSWAQAEPDVVRMEKVGPVSDDTCNCAEKWVKNPSFEQGTNDWFSSGGSFLATAGLEVCGTRFGLLDGRQSAGKIWQRVDSISPGSNIIFSFYASTGKNEASKHLVKLVFFDREGNRISDHTQPIFRSAAADTLLQYQIEGTMPTSGTYLQIEAFASQGMLHLENLCLKVRETVQLPLQTVGQVVLQGSIKTVKKEPIEGVSVKVGDLILHKPNTSNTGIYTLTGLHRNYAQLKIAPSLNDNHLKGISTFDLFLLNQYLLAKSKLDSPLEFIAADVNNSKTVTALDLLELKKLLLGNIQQFSNNTSWRFVDAAYRFPVPFNPWFEVFPESIIWDASQSEHQANFTGIKIGDLDQSAIKDSEQNIAPRSLQQKMAISVEDRELEPGKFYSVDFWTDHLHLLAAYQFTLNFDRSRIRFSAVEPALVKEDHFGLRFLSVGVITTNWIRETKLSNRSRQRLFRLRFQAIRKGRLKDALSLSSNMIKAEAYDSHGNVGPIELTFEDSVFREALPTTIKLYQNRPNPFNQATTIEFGLPYAGTVTLIVWNASGEEIRRMNGQLERGNHTFFLERDQLPRGIYYYQLKTEQAAITKKMVVAD